MSIKLKGSTDGSVTLQAPADTSPTGTDKTFTLPTADGTSGQVLTTNGSGALSFANEGKILQVVQAGTSTEVQVTTQTYTDTGLSGSITPQSTSSKILVIIDQEIYFNRGASSHGGGIRILRDSTVIHTPVANATGPYEFYYSGITGFYDRAVIHKLDSPATTNSVTYKTQGRPYESGSSGKTTFQQAGTSTNGTSYITLIEVAG